MLEMTNQTLLRRIAELESEPSRELKWPPGYPTRLSGENPLDHLSEDQAADSPAAPLRSAGLVERSALELTSFIQHHTIKQQVENAVKVFRASQEFTKNEPEVAAEIPGSVKKILLDRLNILAENTPSRVGGETKGAVGGLDHHVRPKIFSASPSSTGSARKHNGYKKSWH